MTRARDLAAFVSNADGDVKFDTDTLFIDSSANNVGIGTTSPSHPSGSGLTVLIQQYQESQLEMTQQETPLPMVVRFLYLEIRCMCKTERTAISF